MFDNCDSLSVEDVFIDHVTSDEPLKYKNGKGGGDGEQTQDDIVCTSSRSAKLRRKTSKYGDGRVYTVGLALKDTYGNKGTADSVVTVPRSKKRSVVDSGPVVSINCSA